MYVTMATLSCVQRFEKSIGIYASFTAGETENKWEEVIGYRV